jgi:paraquat-inducible protein A
MNLCLCHSCGLACDMTDANARMPALRPAASAQDQFLTRTWAYLFAALAFYVPANLLPVMNTVMLGNGADSTIMSGVLEFWEGGAWDIALIIFHRQSRCRDQVRRPVAAADHRAAQQRLGAP